MSIRYTPLQRRFTFTTAKSPRMTRVASNHEEKRVLERSKSAVRARGRVQTVVKEEARKPIELTLVVLGATEVGKSALVSQFLWEGFVSEYRPTVEEFNWVEYDVGEGGELMLQVIDSSGSRDFLAMRHLYIRTGDAFLIVFAVDSPNSFDEAKKIIEEIFEKKQKRVPILLIANKGDLYADESEWPVKGALEYAQSKGLPLETISAKNYDEVANAFRLLLEKNRFEWKVEVGELKKRRQSMPSTRAYSGIDPLDLEKLKTKHKDRCVIS